MLKSINICGYDYEIEICDLSPEQEKNGELYGQVCYKEHKIQLNSNLCKGEMQATLMHEIIHAITFHTGISEIISSKINEAVASGIGYQLPFIIEQFKKE